MVVLRLQRMSNFREFRDKYKHLIKIILILILLGDTAKNVWAIKQTLDYDVPEHLAAKYDEKGNLKDTLNLNINPEYNPSVVAEVVQIDFDKDSTRAWAQVNLSFDLFILLMLRQGRVTKDE